MRPYLIFFFLTAGILSCNSSTDLKDKQTIENEDRDNGPMQLSGVDEYGMKRYIMAFLKKGPDRSHDSVTAANIQRAHLDNIKRLAEEGKLVLAGPFMDDGEVRGIYVFDVETVEEAEELTATDPAVKAGRLIMELHPWYGSGALMKINSLHKKISRKEI